MQGTLYLCWKSKGGNVGRGRLVRMALSTVVGSRDEGMLYGVQMGYYPLLTLEVEGREYRTESESHEGRVMYGWS